MAVGGRGEDGAAADRGWEVRLLGAVGLRTAEGPVPSASALLRTLLALLAVRPGEVVSTASLVDELWGDALPEHPLGALQIQCTRLRKWLAASGAGATALLHEHGGYLLAARPDQVDLVRFAGAASAAAGHTGHPAGLLERCDVALGHWSGEPFGGCVLGLTLDGERLRASELRLQVVERRCEALMAIGRPEAAVTALQGVLPHHRARERLTALLMAGLYRSGRQQEALAAFQDTRRYLVEEFGIEPAEELTALEAMVLRQAPELRTGRVPDVQAPVGGERPLIVGRVAELDAVSAHRRDRRAGRLVIVTGEAGSGKTTLVGAALHDAAGEGAAVGAGAWDGDGAPLAAWAEALGAAGIDLRDLGLEAAPRGGGLGMALSAALGRRARDGEILLALEDAQLADSASLGLLHTLGRTGVPPGVVVIVTAREPDAVARRLWAAAKADLVRFPATDVIRLGDLSREDARGVVAARLTRLGGAAVSRVSEVLWRQCGGQPLHLGSLLDMMSDLGDERSCLDTARRVPDRLQPLIEHQLAALPGPCRDLVEALAVLGPSSAAGLAEVAGAPPLEVCRLLGPALTLGTVREDGRRFRLRHAVTETAVRGRIPDATCQQLHLGRFLALADRPASPFDLLRHAAGAGPLLDARRLARARLDAGRASYHRGAFAEAASLLRAAKGRLPGREGTDVDLFLGLALVALGRRDEADDLLDGVVASKEASAEQAVAAAVGHEPLGLSAAGDRRRLARLERLFRAGPADSSPARLEVIRALLLEESLVHGEVRTSSALAELARLTELLDSDSDRVRVARLRSIQAREVVDASVDASLRLAAAEEAYRVASLVPDAHVHLDAIELVLSAALAAGQLERCRDLRWELGREAQRIHRPRSIWVAKLLDAALLLASGAAGADGAARAALDEAVRLGIPDGPGAYGVHVMVARWQEGDLASVRGLVDHALATYPNIGAWEAAAAAACLHGGDLDAAHRHLETFLHRRAGAASRHFDRPALCFAAEAALGLRDEKAARQVRDALPPDDRAVVVVGSCAAVLGPVDLYVAMADLTLGDVALAMRRLGRARALADALGWRPWAEACDRLRRAAART